MIDERHPPKDARSYENSRIERQQIRQSVLNEQYLQTLDWDFPEDRLDNQMSALMI